MYKVYFLWTYTRRGNVEQSKGFINHLHPDHVYKLKKTLYKLEQVPPAWYERLTAYLLEHNFIKVQACRTLFIRKLGKQLFNYQIYVDDIVFGVTLDSLHMILLLN